MPKKKPQYTKRGKSPEVLAAKIKAVQKAKRRYDQLADTHRNRLEKVKEREKDLMVNQLRYTEGCRALKHLTDPKAKEEVWPEEDQNKMLELVAMIVEPEHVATYKNWEERAVALQVTVQKVFTYRNTQFFNKALLQAIRNSAAVGVAMALPNQINLASNPDAPTSAAAFAAIQRVAGAEPVEQKSGSVTVNLNFEQQMKKLAIEGGTVIDEKD